MTRDDLRKRERDARIEWIQSLKIPLEETPIMISVKVEGKKIDFWPNSNTYFLHSKQIYGHGIPELCQKILTYLNK